MRLRCFDRFGILRWDGYWDDAPEVFWVAERDRCSEVMSWDPMHVLEFVVTKRAFHRTSSRDGDVHIYVEHDG